MKPPMKQSITFSLPKLNENGEPLRDKYGRPIASEPQEVPARVVREVSIVRDAQGQERRVNLEIDVPPEVEPDPGTEITFTTIGGKTETGTVVTMRDSTNLAGDRVYFRTLYVDG
jgi:hypothetical protein